MKESLKICEDEDSCSIFKPLIQNLGRRRDKPNLRRMGIERIFQCDLDPLSLSDQRIPFLPSTANINMVTKTTFGIFLRSFLITPRFCGCVREEREKLEESFPLSFSPPPRPPSAAANQTRNSTFIFRDCSFHSNIQMKRLFPTRESPLPFVGLGESRLSIVKHSMNLALPIDFQEMLRSTCRHSISAELTLHISNHAHFPSSIPAAIIKLLPLG